jgi:hypothetical protein
LLHPLKLYDASCHSSTIPSSVSIFIMSERVRAVFDNPTLGTAILAVSFINRQAAVRAPFALHH